MFNSNSKPPLQNESKLVAGIKKTKSMKKKEFQKSAQPQKVIITIDPNSKKGTQPYLNKFQKTTQVSSFPPANTDNAYPSHPMS